VKRFAAGDRVILVHDKHSDAEGRPPDKLGTICGYLVRFPETDDTFIVDAEEIELSPVDTLADISRSEQELDAQCKARLAEALDGEELGDFMDRVFERLFRR
jgi:hypothetical protein